MKKETLDSIKIQKATERFRQERETFDLRKRQERMWFSLRLIIGYFAIFLLAIIVVLSGYVLLNNSKFPSDVVTAAQIALFGDILGLIVTVWKIALNPKFITKLEPVTKDDFNEKKINKKNSNKDKIDNNDNTQDEKDISILTKKEDKMSSKKPTVDYEKSFP